MKIKELAMFLGLFLIILSSCSSKDSSSYDDGVEMVRLEMVDSVSFSLDSLTSPITSSVCYYDGILSFLSNNREIIFYNYSTQDEYSRISTRGVGVSSHQIINSDSLVLFDYTNNKIVLKNMKSEVLDEFVIEKSIPYYPAPLVRISPIIFMDSVIVFTGNIGGEGIGESKDNRLVSGQYDISKKHVKYFTPYPEIYRKKNYGGGLFRWVYSDYNEKNNTIIYSFPASHYIYEVELNGYTIKKYYAGSKYIRKIKPIGKSKVLNINAEKRTKHFAETPSYANMFYDKDRDLYYRFAELPTKYFGVPGWNKEISVIILDKNFNIIGETYIGEVSNINRYASFVNSKGLHMIKRNKNEDEMVFHIFSVCDE